ncbi:MAG: tRNA (N6-threonylcarbamoyladenosine(37)-N6)-methyltransferase TrmO [Candidatus Bathyarchaeota archaeon]|nr:MAG: tRNA (N6-threonylcarbamoyladenosine(37)-N6)-methyltransferase TrmO [Candidatus Bathyarchaeota archaeon]
MPKMKGKAELEFIGVVEKEGEQEAKICIFPKFCAGLKDIENYSHLIILYWFHLRDNKEDRRTLLVYPKKHAVKIETGVFACRSPSRPNPIGLCVVELLKVEKCMLTVKRLDAFTGSPIIDIKPYNPGTDSVPNAKVPEWAH